MILLGGRILGFGKLSDLRLVFREGVNLVFAPNEGGKSTLHRFLVGMLYGQLRSDLKMQRRPEPWVEQYRPWRAAEYGGILWCRLAGGRELEVHRSFGAKEARVEIRTASGEDISREYEQQRNGEVLFARHHFGIPKELFESVATIRENRSAEIAGYETIRDRIANLAQSGDEELSIRRSLAKIGQNLESIGTERAPTKPYRQAQELVESLKSERRALEERKAQFEAWLGEKNRIAGTIAELESAHARAEGALQSARRREVSSRVRALEEVEGDLGRLRAEMDALGAREDFPAEGLEELDRLAGARDHIARRLGEIGREKEAAFEVLSRAESERTRLENYAPLASGADAEKITEWFVSYLGLSLQKDGVQKTLTRLREEAGGLERRLGEMSPALRDPGEDWQRSAREAAEDEQAAAERCAALAEPIAQAKSGHAEAGQKLLRRRAAAVCLGILAAVSGCWPLFAPGISQALAVGLAGALAAAGALAWMAARAAAGAGKLFRGKLEALEAEQRKIREEGGRKRAHFHAAMAGSGFQRTEDFLGAARAAEGCRQKLAEVQAGLSEAAGQQERMQAQSDELYELLRDALAHVGLSCSPGSLKFQIDVLRQNLRRFRELDAARAGARERAETLQSQHAELAREFDQKGGCIQELLDGAGVSSVEEYRRECAGRQKFLEMRDRASSRAREAARLAGGLSLAHWRLQLEELLRQEAPEPVLSDPGPDASAPLLPYLPTLEQAEEAARRTAAELAAAREEYARASERVRQAFQNSRTLSEIEEDLATAESRFERLDRNRLALGIALETLENLSRQQQEVLAPQLNAAVEQRFLRLCRDRYEEVKIDPDFQVWVRERDTGELRAAELLSRGTQDQLYFAMRFGILDLIASEGEPCPCFLDEPFAAYDHVRLEEAFRVLAGESDRRQTFLFTCREDLLELAGRHGANLMVL